MESLDIAKDVFEIEANAIQGLSSHLTDDFNKAVAEILKSRGKLIVSGVGKSGIIGKKISATLASTGTPSFFLHPAEAYHGDLGMVEKHDIVLLISNSGESDEVLKLVPFFKHQKNTIIAMSSTIDSTLAKHSDYHLNVSVEQEACPLQLAPTSSTTATLVMGDALAVALMKHKKFQKSDFAQFHPGGSLGRKLLTKVGDIMKQEHLPVATRDDEIIDIVHKISKCGFGLCVIHQEDQIVGVITDGDIRRAMREQQQNFFALHAKDLMNKDPKIVTSDTLVHKAQMIMDYHKINTLLVTSNQKFVGIIQIYDVSI
jgi:arabinose-5-phosphate isomerase